MRDIKQKKYRILVNKHSNAIPQQITTVSTVRQNCTYT